MSGLSSLTSRMSHLVVYLFLNLTVSHSSLWPLVVLLLFFLRINILVSTCYFLLLKRGNQVAVEPFSKTYGEQTVNLGHSPLQALQFFQRLCTMCRPDLCTWRISTLLVNGTYKITSFCWSMKLRIAYGLFCS